MRTLYYTGWSGFLNWLMLNYNEIRKTVWNLTLSPLAGLHTCFCPYSWSIWTLHLSSIWLCWTQFYLAPADLFTTSCTILIAPILHLEHWIFNFTCTFWIADPSIRTLNQILSSFDNLNTPYTKSNGSFENVKPLLWKVAHGREGRIHRSIIFKRIS